jgi:hypothetical protein
MSAFHVFGQRDFHLVAGYAKRRAVGGAQDGVTGE